MSSKRLQLDRVSAPVVQCTKVLIAGVPPVAAAHQAVPAQPLAAGMADKALARVPADVDHIKPVIGNRL
jgi:hypothetical protein